MHEAVLPLAKTKDDLPTRDVIGATSATAACYLVRFDDVCPTMNWHVWERIEILLVENQIRPIVAVVPDNQDATLAVSSPDGRFWQRVRAWQSRGWSIALHGYQHRYVNANGGILNIARRSEFAGLPPQEQETKLRAALAIFASEGVRADAWVAPSHSFDKTTVQLLFKVGIHVISDGLSILPFRCAEGMTWVPQQLWDFQARRRGVWTVCFHPNGWNEARFRLFSRGLGSFLRKIVSLNDVLQQWPSRSRDARDRLFQALFLARLRFSPALNKVRLALRMLRPRGA